MRASFSKKWSLEITSDSFSTVSVLNHIWWCQNPARINLLILPIAIKLSVRLILNKIVGKLPIFWHLAGNVVNHDFLSEFWSNYSKWKCKKTAREGQIFLSFKILDWCFRKSKLYVSISDKRRFSSWILCFQANSRNQF